VTTHTRVQALIAVVPESDWNELRRLRALTTTVRGWTPLDDPARLAGDAQFALIKRIHEEYGISLWSMATHLGLNGRTLKYWMFAHGHGKQPASQKPYRGVVIERASHGENRKLKPGGVCRHGHLLTDADILRRTDANVCRICHRERSKRYYAARVAKR